MAARNLISKAEKEAAILAFIQASGLEVGLTQVWLDELYLLFLKWLEANKYDFAPTKRRFAQTLNTRFRSVHASITEDGKHTSKKVYYLSKPVGNGG